MVTGGDDLVAVPSAPGQPQRYRPRTEGAFGRIEHHAYASDPTQDTWEVRGIDGRLSFFGGLDAGSELAAIVDPTPGVQRIFGWALTWTEDAFGNQHRVPLRARPGPRRGGRRHTTAGTDLPVADPLRRPR